MINNNNKRYNVPLALPEIVVVGMQSVGKSSLIEAFAGLRLNNCGYGIIINNHN